MHPKITVLMITVRPDAAYLEHPEWSLFGKIVDDLNAQTFQDFELVVVDGLYKWRDNGGGLLDLRFHDKEVVRKALGRASFPYQRRPPKTNLWTRNKKCCISNYRNTGIANASGELVVNIDDVHDMPPTYLELFWRAWSEKKICLSATWPHNGDQRIPRNDILNPDRVYVQKYPAMRGQVFGYGSYPLDLALQLNGYDEAYDGAMYLEDIDWGSRLYDAGLKMHFAYIPGFRLHSQSKHDERAVDLKRPVVKCCNAAYQTQQVWRTCSTVNTKELWTTEALNRLIGPCHYMGENHMCMHWGGRQMCEYVKDQHLDDNGVSFALERDELAARIFDEPPVRDLRKERETNRG